MSVKPSEVEKGPVGWALGKRRSETASRASWEYNRNGGLESSARRGMRRVVAFAPAVVEERMR